MDVIQAVLSSEQTTRTIPESIEPINPLPSSNHTNDDPTKIEENMLRNYVIEDTVKFYSNAKDYWSSIPATVDGMLGGYARISPTDINGSKEFLCPFLSPPNSKERAVDCGAGIGRITKRLLLPLFKTVDMVEQNKIYLDQAKEFIGTDFKRIGKLICTGLQDFVPEPGTYNVIWAQWVLGHLTDDDLVTFFKNCHKGLAPGGVICVKENVAGSGKREFDGTDSSWTRTLSELESIMEKAGLTIVKAQKQKGFPRCLYDVYMFSLR